MLGAAPALEAVIPIIKKFKPEPIFQGETSDDVEAAWEEIQGRRSKHIHLSTLPKAESDIKQHITALLSLVQKNQRNSRRQATNPYPWCWNLTSVSTASRCINKSAVST